MKFSIIIPVYNSAKYLTESLDSILSQSYEDYEVIIVDDGSTDESDVICDEYVSKDIRFKVIHKSNEGVSYARNVALDNISGEWVVFLDSDDMLHEAALAVLNEKIKNDPELDVVQFGVTRRPFGTSFIDYSKVNVISGTPEEYCKFDHYNVSIGGSAFRRETIISQAVRFDEKMKLAEDQVFVFHMIHVAKKCSMLAVDLYYYRINENSATSTSRQEDMVVTIDAVNKYKLIYPLSVAQFDSIILLFLYNLTLDSCYTIKYISSLFDAVQIDDISKSLSGPKLLYYLSRVSSFFAVAIIRLLNLGRR
jgi:glycosyltransferase involved in cell wall biosynthesis